MSGPRKISPELGDRIDAMAAAGMDIADIAREVGIGRQKVKGWIASYRNRKYGVQIVRRSEMMDGIVDGRHVRGLTPDDLRRLREIDAENERAEDEGRKPDYSGVR